MEGSRKIRKRNTDIEMELPIDESKAT